MKYAGNTTLIEQNPSRGFQSTVSNILIFGLDKSTLIDTLTVDWIGGKRQILTKVKSNQLLVLEEKNADRLFEMQRNNSPLFTEINSLINFNHIISASNDFSRQPLLINQLSHFGPVMEQADLNNDGLKDIVLGSGIGQSSKIFLQQKSGNYTEKSLSNSSQSAIADIAVFDANIDGFQDIYLAHGGYDQFKENDNALQDELFLNDKNGGFIKANLPKITSSKSVVAPVDVNKDGNLDLFVGSRVNIGNWPQSVDNYLLINDGKGNFTNRIDEFAPDLRNIGMITDAKSVDLNNDKINELVVVGDMMPLQIFEIKEGKLMLNSEKYLSENYSGFYSKLATGDFNRDGKPDLIIGNLGLNSQLKVIENEPIEMVYGDFDKNGTTDPIMSCYFAGKSHPYITRDEFFMQFAGLKPRYITYESYADATAEAIFDKGELNSGKKLKVDNTETILLLSNVSGKLKKVNLPIQAQYACVNDLLVFDFDKDNSQDILLVGNNKYFKIRLGKHDANYGILLRNDGKGNFSYVNQIKSGFKLNGDIKSVLNIDRNLFFGVNEGKIQTYKYSK